MERTYTRRALLAAAAGGMAAVAGCDGRTPPTRSVTLQDGRMHYMDDTRIDVELGLGYDRARDGGLQTDDIRFDGALDDLITDVTVGDRADPDAGEDRDGYVFDVAYEMGWPYSYRSKGRFAGEEYHLVGRAFTDDGRGIVVESTNPVIPENLSEL